MCDIIVGGRDCLGLSNVGLIVSGQLYGPSCVYIIYRTLVCLQWSPHMSCIILQQLYIVYSGVTVSSLRGYIAISIQL